MYKTLIEEFKDDILSLNDYMAENPEISSQEYKSSQKIVQLLNKYNIETEYPFAGLDTAFKGTINKGKSRKAAILVEYDALRGMGHGCGHCASGSISILSALILNEIKDEIDAQIDIIGTPDEEMRGAKAIMANQGVFDGYDFAIMIHMASENYIYNKSLALDSYEFKYIGKPAHAAASPWSGRNALNATRLLFDSVDMMRQHVKDDVRIHGIIESGGIASNIVPELAVAEFTIRSLDRTYLDEVSEWVKDCAKAAAMATRTQLVISQIGEKYNEQINNQVGSKVLEDIYGLLNQETLNYYNTIGGSSDIGNVDYKCPMLQPYLSIGQDYGVHTVEFAEAMTNDKTHEAIFKGGEIIARFVTTMYDNPDILKDMIEEHRIARKI